MPRRKKGAVGKKRGAMCNICGLNCGKGGALKKHVEFTHDIKYDDYRKCFYEFAKAVLAESWDDSVSTSKNKTVLIHVLVRRFIREPGARGATRTVPVKR